MPCALLYVTRIIVAVTRSLYSKSFGRELAVTEPGVAARADATARRRNPLVRIARKITSYGCNELGGSLREARRIVRLLRRVLNYSHGRTLTNFPGASSLRRRDATLRRSKPQPCSARETLGMTTKGGVAAGRQNGTRKG